MAINHISVSRQHFLNTSLVQKWKLTLKRLFLLLQHSEELSSDEDEQEEENEEAVNYSRYGS